MPAAGSQFMPDGLTLAASRSLSASLEASAAMARDDVFVKLYDLLILIICCVS